MVSKPVHPTVCSMLASMLAPPLISLQPFGLTTHQLKDAFLTLNSVKRWGQLVALPYFQRTSGALEASSVAKDLHWQNLGEPRHMEKGLVQALSYREMVSCLVRYIEIM